MLGATLSLYGYGMAAGGPALIVWAWVLGGGLTLLVALSLAEVCSALPDAGSLHVYAGKLARRHPAEPPGASAGSTPAARSP